MRVGGEGTGGSGQAEQGGLEEKMVKGRYFDRNDAERRDEEGLICENPS